MSVNNGRIALSFKDGRLKEGQRITGEVVDDLDRIGAFLVSNGNILK